MNYHHISILTNQVVFYLRAQEKGLFIDCTFGGGGHTQKILEAHPKNQVIALDCDSTAIKNGKAKLTQFSPPSYFSPTKFSLPQSN